MTARLALFAALIAAAALPATAQVHRWVDEQGRVHYGDRPLGTTGTTLRIRAESATAPAAARVAPGAPAVAAAALHRPAPPSAARLAAGSSPSTAARPLPQGHVPRETTPVPREEPARVAGVRARGATCSRAQGSPGC